MQTLTLGKRFFSVILSIAIILCSLCVLPITAQADDAGYTMGTLTHKQTASISSSNLLASRTAIRVRRTATANTSSYVFTYMYSLADATAGTRLTDGDSADWNYGNDSVVDEITRPSGSGVGIQKSSSAVDEDVVQIIFVLGSTANFEASSFLVSWAQTAPVKSYKIYVSAKDQWSYNSNKTLVAEVTGETASECNRIITLDTPATGFRTVGFEFSAADFSAAVNYNGGDWNGILLTELGAYKEAINPEDFLESDVTNQEIADMSSNNLLNSNYYCSDISSSYYYGESSTQIYLRSPSYLTDGLAGRTGFKHSEDADGIAYGGSSAESVKIAYSLNGTQTVKKLLLSWTADAPATAYNIYLSDSKDTLYSEENIIAAKTGEPAITFNRLITLDEAKTGSYIGFEFTELTAMTTPSANCVVLMELGAYGYISDITDSEIAAISSDNLLASGQFYNTAGEYVYNSGSKPYLRHSSYLTNGLTGRTGYTHSEDADGILFGMTSNQTEEVIRITYGFENAFEIEKLLLSWTAAAPATSYNIYIGDDKDALYGSDNLVVEKTDEPAVTFNRLIILDEVKSGKYIGFEFTALTAISSLSNKKSVVLMELGAYAPLDMASYAVNDSFLAQCSAETETVSDGECVIAPATSGVNALVINGTGETYGVYVSSDSETLFNGEPVITCGACELVVFSATVNLEYIGIKGDGLESVSAWSDYEMINGDLNGDLEIDADDLVMLRKELLYSSDLDLEIKDVNDDGSFNILDLINLKKKQ